MILFFIFCRQNQSNEKKNEMKSNEITFFELMKSLEENKQKKTKNGNTRQ